MTIQELLDRIYHLDREAEITLKTGEEFTVVPTGNGETITGYAIVEANVDPCQLKLPFSRVEEMENRKILRDEPKDSIGE